MPVLKVKRNGAWVDIVESISDADTLDGRHADAFALAKDVDALRELFTDTKTSEKFVVTITTNDDGTYSADKTFAEVKAAIDIGDITVASWTVGGSKLIGQYTSGDETALEFTFHSFLGADQYMVLENDNTITHLVSEIGEHEMPSQVNVTKDGSIVTVRATVPGSLGGWGEEITTITLDYNDYPISVIKDGNTCQITWTGFD